MLICANGALGLAFEMRIARACCLEYINIVNRRSAFSLIELLVTMAIIIILTSLYWGSGSASRQKQAQKECRKNLQNIYIAMQIYANDHAGKFPDVPGARTSEEAL